MIKKRVGVFIILFLIIILVIGEFIYTMSSKSYFEYDLNKNSSYVVVDKKIFNEIERSEIKFNHKLELLLESVLKEVDTCSLSQNDKILLNETKSFLEGINVNSKDHEIKKVELLFVLLKADKINSNTWFKYPRYFFSSDFIDLYKGEDVDLYNCFFCYENLKDVEMIDKNKFNDFVSCEYYPMLYMSSNGSNLDPTFLDLTMKATLKGDAVLLKVNEGVFKIDDKYNFSSSDFEKKILRLRRDYLNFNIYDYTDKIEY